MNSLALTENIMATWRASAIMFSEVHGFSRHPQDALIVPLIKLRREEREQLRFKPAD